MSLFSLLFVRSVGHTANENQKLIARKSASSSSVVRATVGIFSQLFVSLSKRNNLNNTPFARWWCAARDTKVLTVIVRVIITARNECVRARERENLSRFETALIN